MSLAIAYLRPRENKRHGSDRCRPNDADACCQSPGCTTIFRWECRPGLRRVDRKAVLLHVKRHLSNLLSPFNPRWMAQVVSVPDENWLEAYWQDCHEWRDVNMMIEEMKYERELQSKN
ncbi:uncharacterized protein BDV17DRAFT_277132 [Aspergillus undulatus]|uniref:uncharacterized protein n=1 Tax=Aspergillus undulatus TaxID=1810928 RepID=UPI003CCC98BC